MIGYAIAVVCIGLLVGFAYKSLLLKVVKKQGPLYQARRKAAKWGFWSAIIIISSPTPRIQFSTSTTIAMKVAVWIWLGVFLSLFYLLVCYLIQKLKRSSSVGG